MRSMGYRQFTQRLMSDVTGKLSALLGVGTRPTHWLTMTDRKSRRPRSVSVSLYQVDGRTYVIDTLAATGKGWSKRLCVPGKGTLSGGRADTDVTLTEVTDPGVRQQVAIACAAMAPKVLLAFGEDKDREPAGLAAPVPDAAVFEVKAGQSTWIVGGALLILILAPGSRPGCRFRRGPFVKRVGGECDTRTRPARR